jgi:simple sugar transport system ATP-binding protein
MQAGDRTDPVPGDYLVELRGVSKTYGSMYAVQDVDFHVGRAEIVGLIGDNGAGKSTLIRIIAGVHPPDAGELYVRGKKIESWSAAKARDAKIETVYQDRALAEQQTIASNVFMGRELTGPLGLLKVKEQNEEAERLMRYLGFTSQVFAPDSIVGRLSGGERQGVAIARALYFKADLIILDEPTTALSLTESKKVLDFQLRAKEEGSSSIFITHTIAHAYDVADRLVIMDRGRIAGEFRKGDIALDSLIADLQAVARSGHLAGGAG